MEYSYPKGEIVWVGHYDKDHNLRYITTSKPARDFYFLYELKGGKFAKLYQAASFPKSFVLVTPVNSLKSTLSPIDAVFL